MTVGSLTREKSLYDLLGARPDDDAERLKAAFRKAAKANHPDLHGGDQGAPVRFRRIVEAYDVLRDAEQRAAYDRLLAFERERPSFKPSSSKPKRTGSHFTYSIVSNTVAVVGLASVLAGGYTLFTHKPKAPVEAAKVVGVTAPRAARIAVVRPAARTETPELDEKHDNIGHMAIPDVPMMVPGAVALAANDGGALDFAKGGPAPSAAGLDADVAKINDAFGAPIRHADPTSAANHLEKNPGIEPFDNDKAQSVEARSSSVEKDSGVPKSALSDFAMSDDKRDIKIPDTFNHDIKISETKAAARPRTMAKRQPPGPRPVRQVSLESRNTPACSGSCSSGIPPLFGVGF